jgi:hypothetical protein
LRLFSTISYATLALVAVSSESVMITDEEGEGVIPWPFCPYPMLPDGWAPTPGTSPIYFIDALFATTSAPLSRVGG